LAAESGSRCSCSWTCICTHTNTSARARAAGVRHARGGGQMRGKEEPAPRTPLRSPARDRPHARAPPWAPTSSAPRTRWPAAPALAVRLGSSARSPLRGARVGEGSGQRSRVRGEG
jgi:hypothetical protein